MSLFGDLNEIKIMGNMTGEPELRYTPSGAAVCNFSVATNRRFKQGEEWKDETEFHNVVVWGNLAQQLTQRAHKGTRVMVVGRMQTRNWDSQDGKKNYKTEIIAEDAFLIDRYEKGKSADLTPVNSSDNQNTSTTNNSDNSANNSSNFKKNDVIDPDDLPF